MDLEMELLQEERDGLRAMNRTNCSTMNMSCDELDEEEDPYENSISQSEILP